MIWDFAQLVQGVFFMCRNPLFCVLHLSTGLKQWISVCTSPRVNSGGDANVQELKARPWQVFTSGVIVRGSSVGKTDTKDWETEEGDIQQILSVAKYL